MEESRKTFGIAGSQGWSGNLRSMLIVAAICALVCSASHAQTNSWTNPSGGFWDDFRNWSLGVRPTNSDFVFIKNAPSKTVTIDWYTSGTYPDSMTISDLTVSASGGVTNTLFLSDAGTTTPLQIHDTLMIVSGGALLMTNSSLLVGDVAGVNFALEAPAAFSGANFLAGGVAVGYSSNSVGSVTVIDGETAFTNGYMTIGFYGSAQVTLLSGSLQTEDDISAPNGMFVGFGPASQGVVSIFEGQLLVPEQLSLGEDAGSAGQLWLDGGQIIATNNFLVTVGGNAVGQAVVSNGQIAASYIIVGDALGSSGTLTLAGGTINISGAMTIAQGQNATGSVFITGGQLSVTNQGVSVGGFGVGQMTVSNGSLLARNVIVGDCENSQGTLTVAGGAVSVASSMTAGARAYMGTATTTNANAGGVIQMTGGSLTVTNQSGTGLLTIGRSGNGSLVQNGGLVQVDQLTIAASSVPVIVGPGNTNVFFSGAGRAVLSNGVLFAQTVALGLGTNCHGTLTIAGGTISISSNIVAGVGSNAAGVIQISGGVLTVTNQSATGQLVVGQNGAGTLLQSGGTATVDQLLVMNGNSSVFSLNSGVFNTRSTTVSDGQTFFVGDGVDAATYHLLGGTHSFANGLEIRSNAVLSGCGTINGAILVDPGGMVQAGCGGVLTFTGIVTNDGAVVASNGGTVESYGPVVNDGVINIIDGNTNFHSGFVNNGVVLTADSIPRIISITAVGTDIRVEFTTTVNLPYWIESTGDLSTGNWIPLLGFFGSGGTVTFIDSNTVLQTQRFYRVRLVVPQ